MNYARQVLFLLGCPSHLFLNKEKMGQSILFTFSKMVSKCPYQTPNLYYLKLDKVS